MIAAHGEAQRAASNLLKDVVRLREELGALDARNASEVPLYERATVIRCRDRVSPIPSRVPHRFVPRENAALRPFIAAEAVGL